MKICAQIEHSLLAPSLVFIWVQFHVITAEKGELTLDCGTRSLYAEKASPRWPSGDPAMLFIPCSRSSHLASGLSRGLLKYANGLNPEQLLGVVPRPPCLLKAPQAIVIWMNRVQNKTPYRPMFWADIIFHYERNAHEMFVCWLLGAQTVSVTQRSNLPHQ